MVNLGITVAGGKGTKSIRGPNAHLRDVLGYKQEDRANQLGQVERTIQRWDKEDKEDRGRPCVQHVFTRETEREKAPSKPLGAVSSEKIAEVERCRFCGFEKRRTRFFHIAMN